MFPMEFDHNILSTLPIPGEERVKSICQLLKAIVMRRVLPYFKQKRGTDSMSLARAPEHLTVSRLEDERSQIRTVSALTHSNSGEWIIHVHERIFDYLAFVIPSDPESRLEGGTIEELKMLAFAELFLRHEIDHVLYPERKEREVIAADADFAMDRRKSDPTFYRRLREALSDEMNGIKGAGYLTLLDAAERGLGMQAPVDSIIGAYIGSLTEAPWPFLQIIYPSLDPELKMGILGEHWRRSHDGASPLLQRTSSIRKFLRLFDTLVKRDETEASEVFQAFRDRWGMVGIFRELSMPEPGLDRKPPGELFKSFKAALQRYIEEDGESVVSGAVMPAKPVQTPEVKKPERAEKSLKDRIEEARNDPRIPRRAMETIDKNKLNAVGHSGSKYSELIETLLAIPWGRINKIEVSPAAFEEGLNRTHFGLQRPKELLCDFFTNLIWRYQRFSDEEAASWTQTGSAFLLVGPPGVGKTSLAMSVAKNLGIPYHKISLGGMRDEADIRGHGFTYEGSKPGAILQGLIKMEAMNGMFILDEADKTEKFAIATLLEILDPEQNHLFHDKYTETTVDIDLSNCHFFLTANTLDTVPQVVVNRCEVIQLDRYSVEEKIAIARQHLIRRIRSKYWIDPEMIYFHEEQEDDLLRYLVRSYTYEAGVRELERVIRTLFLRLQRKEVLGRGVMPVRITRETIKTYLKEPVRPRQISERDDVGEMLALGVDSERGVGSVIPIQATRIASEVATGAGASRRGFISVVHATGNIEKVMDESRKVAMTGILHCAAELGIGQKDVEESVHLHFMGGSTRKDGPSAGGAIALSLASLLAGRKVRRDVAMTGEIDTRGRITGIGALAVKIETACSAGCRTVIIPRDNLHGEDGIERFPDALKDELQILTYEEWVGQGYEPFDYSKHILQVVAVDNIHQASQVAFIDDGEIERVEGALLAHASRAAEALQRAISNGRKSLLIVQAKKLDEVDPAFLGSIPFRQGYDEAYVEVVLLVSPDIYETVLARPGSWKDRVTVRSFDRHAEDLCRVAAEILKTSSGGRICSGGAAGNGEDGRLEPGGVAAEPVRLAVVAPYYFLKRCVMEPDALSCDMPFAGICLFANNYTAQNVKIKGCKAILDQVYGLLALLEPVELDECPFLARQDTTWVVDMSFIPEKYRLDLRRAEQILNRSLQRWLDAIWNG